MIGEIAAKAKKATFGMASLSPEVKNNALAAIREGLEEARERIFAANERDLAQARQGDLKAALVKRLKFDTAKLDATLEGIESLIGLEDPVGKTISCMELDQGLELYKITCPIGLLGIIFESRPDALVQIATLALKSGNGVLLKGGSEAAHTNKILAAVIIQSSEKAGIPSNWMALLETRQDVKEMLELHEFIDLVIPRGSNEFVRYIMDHTHIHVLGHADGICHVFIDREADLEKAVRIAYDSKCQYPAVCNAMETLLVDEPIAGRFLPRIKAQYDTAGVELRGDRKSCKLIYIKAASEADWSTEYNDLILSVKIVDGSAEAIDHINHYGSRHTDAIVSENQDKAREFLGRVDSANVFWNCSTRYSDGFRYGLGAEVGISTNKIHARGPVGLEGLISYKYKLIGNGQIVADYSGQDAKSFTHQSLDNKCPL